MIAFTRVSYSSEELANCSLLLFNACCTSVFDSFRLRSIKLFTRTNLSQPPIETCNALHDQAADSSLGAGERLPSLTDFGKKAKQNCESQAKRNACPSLHSQRGFVSNGFTVIFKCPRPFVWSIERQSDRTPCVEQFVAKSNA